MVVEIIDWVSEEFLEIPVLKPAMSRGLLVCQSVQVLGEERGNGLETSTAPKSTKLPVSIKD